MNTKPQDYTRAVSRDRLIEAFRQAVLQSFDETAREVFRGSPTLGRDAGATDADLPALFATVDRHAETLAARFGFIVNENDEYRQDAKPDDFKLGQRLCIHPLAWKGEDRSGQVVAISKKGVWLRLDRSQRIARFSASLVCVSARQEG